MPSRTRVGLAALARVALSLVGALLWLAPSAGTASAAGPPALSTPPNAVLGAPRVMPGATIIGTARLHAAPTRGNVAPLARRAVTTHPPAPPGDSLMPGRAGSGLLTYHGGPTLAGGTAQAVLIWQPVGGPTSISADYQSWINYYFQEETYQISRLNATEEYFGGHKPPMTFPLGQPATIDTDPFPANGCVDPNGRPVCLSFGQLEQEVLSFAQQHALGLGATQFMLLLPNGASYDAGGFFDQDSCGWHTYDPVPGLTFAVVGYGAGSRVCTFGQRPNNSDADETESVISHELDEEVTDPQLTGWYFNDLQHENGDQCAWVTNPAHTYGPSGHEYNESFNIRNPAQGAAMTQLEWSNYYYTNYGLGCSPV